MRVTSKGQVTIPKDIRDEAGLLPGAAIECAIAGKVVQITRSKQALSQRRQLLRRLRGSATVDMSADEIMALTRG